MPTSKWPSPHQKIVNMAMILVAAGILLFTGFLLLGNYKSQVKLRDIAVDRFKSDAEQRANSLKFFFANRRDDLKNLAESRVVNVYFENQALGMSMLYGLRASLVAIHQQIRTLIQRQTHNGSPAYTSIRLINDKGEVLVSSEEDPPLSDVNGVPTVADIGTINLPAAIDLDEQSFVVSEPVYFKNQTVGWMVARVDSKCLGRYLIRLDDGGRTATGFIFLDEHRYLDSSGLYRLSEQQIQWFSRIPDGAIQRLGMAKGDARSVEHLVYKVPIADTPLAYIGLVPAEEVFGGTAPWHIPAALTAISVVLFCGLIFLWRQKMFNLVLKTRLDEAAKREQAIAQKNLDLEDQIEKRHEIETRLRESELRFRNLVESTNDWFWEVDVNGVYTYVGPQVKSLLGYDPAQVLGRAVFEFMPEKESTRVKAFFENIVTKHGALELLENTLIHKEGHHVVVQTSGMPIMDAHGNVLGYRGTDRDITEKIKLEERLRQAQKMKSIGTLAGGIAHDFNNILSIMIGNAELAMDVVPEWNPGHRHIEEIKTAGLKGANIVKQLLSFSRKSSHQLRPIDLKPVIEDTLDLIRASISSSIEIRRNLPAIDGSIVADPIQINQVIMNLCINASQSMEESGGIIDVSIEKVLSDGRIADGSPELSEGQFVKITISDTGMGIDPKIIDRIFDPYFTTKEVGKGSGMGLAVVHGIVKNHGGVISVKSAPGKGSAFSIYLPLVEAKPDIGAGETAAIQGGSETILFVDDERSIVEMITRILGRLGYRVKSSTSPLEAFELFKAKSEEIDLVITDMAMPKMNGVRLSEKLKEIRPDIPLIICTGHSDLIDEEKALQMGIAAYVMKPITRQEIAATIRNVLDG